MSSSARTEEVKINSSSTAASATTVNSLREELNKSVSFFSSVTVHEFAVPAYQRKIQKDWPSYLWA